jgi:hypothetical protein
MVMKSITLALAVVLFPALVRADGLATAACVLDRATFDKLAPVPGAMAKVPTPELLKATLAFGVLGDSYAGSFKVGAQTYRERYVNHIFFCGAEGVILAWHEPTYSNGGTEVA